MMYLLLSIFFSTLILVIFRLFKIYGVNTFQAIVFNYVIAFIVGFSLYGSSWDMKYVYEENSWIPFALLIGALFISLFLLMGKSSQENGIGITSVTVKMSLAIPVLMAIIIYSEAVYATKVIGIVLALIGVFLITYQKKQTTGRDYRSIMFLIILFLGSGLLDTLLNYVEKRALGELSPALFSAIGFGIAGTFGLIVLLVALLMKKQKIHRKNMIAGIVLGIPNFFSIYFLIMAIRQPMEDSITYAMNNVGIVMASYIVGIIFFKEATTTLKIIGGTVSVVAILLLAF